jgi:hypothetical protein
MGAVWKYNAVISYADANDNTKLIQWTGIITDRVIKKAETGGKTVYTVQKDMEPAPPGGVWRQPGPFEYTVSGNEIFKDSIKIYQYPLGDNQSWQASPDTIYKVTSQHVGEVDTPYGKLNNCYTLTYATNPDTTVETFCPGTGIVRHTYEHHGSSQSEKFELFSFTPGKP